MNRIGRQLVILSVLCTTAGLKSTGAMGQQGTGGATEVDLAMLVRSGGVRADSRQVSELIDGARRGVRLTAAPSFDVAWIDGVSFTSGTIELEVRGKNLPMQSFLGIAFAGANDSTFESVYLRPFNFQQTDTLRQNHSLQYESMPAYPWARLRAEQPEVFENPVLPVPDPSGWVRLRVVVEPTRLEIYAGEGAEPDLVVQRINPSPGRNVGLWVGNISEGEFANLRLTPRP